MNSFDILLNKFKLIKEKGYIKSINNYNNGGGLTLENELGSTGGDFNIPDFMDIEIKSIYKYRFASIDLFNSAPDGSHFPAAPWITENYGYPDKDYKNIKVFKGTVYGNKKNKIGYKYSFKLDVDEIKQKIILNVYRNDILVNDEIYWDFDTIKDKLLRKDSKIAIIFFNKKLIKNSFYYKYESIQLFELKNFETLLLLIKTGKVYIMFKTGVHKSGKYIGKFADHGTSFRIEVNDLHYLFNRYN